MRQQPQNHRQQRRHVNGLLRNGRRKAGEQNITHAWGVAGCLDRCEEAVNDGSVGGSARGRRRVGEQSEVDEAWHGEWCEREGCAAVGDGLEGIDGDGLGCEGNLLQLYVKFILYLRPFDGVQEDDVVLINTDTNHCLPHRTREGMATLLANWS